MGAFDSVALINAVADLAELLGRTTTTDSFLADLVRIVAEHMRTDVCSVYLYEEEHATLVLRATVGLNPRLVGAVRLARGEGLTGSAFLRDAPVLETDAPHSALNKRIPDLGEESYPAFLGVPIKRNNNGIGVLVLQHHSPAAFDDNAVRTVRAIASHLAATLENAAFLYEIHEPSAHPLQHEDAELFQTGLINGTSASRGVGIGALEYLEDRTVERIDNPTRSLHEAIELSYTQLQELQRQVDQTLSDVASLIFSSHLLMLRDNSFVGKMRVLHEQQGFSEVQAVNTVVDEFCRLFGGLSDPRFQEKIQDVQDLGHRILRNLADKAESKGDYRGQVVAAHTLFPSELVKLYLQHVEGILFAGGSTTSHIAILAQSLEVPVVGSADARLFRVPNGTRVIVDAEDGKIVVNPAAEILDAYRQRMAAQHQEHDSALSRRIDTEVCTGCGDPVQLLANVNLVKDARAARAAGAGGIGLYRSEFPFLIRNGFPTEEEQVAVYQRVAETVTEGPIRFRTLDLGGDKLMSMQAGTEENPFLGFRGIRFTLANRELFREQLRAMLRAGHGRNVGIMFPMISSLEEFLAAKEEVAACIESLQRDGLPHNPNPALGLMVELPAAIEIAADLSLHADFLSIGTNDLVMYILAADRTNPSVASLYRTIHPAVIRSLKRLADAMGPDTRKLSVCGASAADAAMVVFYLGLGIRTFSVDAHSLAAVADIVSRIDINEAIEIAATMLQLSSSASLERVAEELRRRFAP